MRIKVMILLLITLLVGGCGGGGSDPKADAGLETVTAYAGGDKTENGPGSVITLTGTASSSKASALTYSWTVVGGDASKVAMGTPTALSTSFTATAEGTYTLQFKATSTADLTVSSTSNAVITVIPRTTTESLTVTAGDDLTAKGPSAGDAVTLNGSANFVIGPVTYAWSVSGSNAANAHFGSATSAVTTFYADQPGTYNVQLTATSTGGAGATATKTAVVTVLDDTVLGAKSSYFPLVPGSVWVYKETSTGNTVRREVLSDFTIYATIVSTSGTSHNVSRYSFLSNKVFLTETTADGTVSGTPVTFTTSYNYNGLNASDLGLLQLPSSLVSGPSESSIYNEATYTDSNSATPTQKTATVTVVGTEDVTVNGVTYPAVKLQTVIGTTTSNSWYVRGIGLVKDSSKYLVSYTPG